MFCFLQFSQTQSTRSPRRETASGPARHLHDAVFARVIGGNCALDVFVSPLVADTDAGAVHFVLWTGANLGAQHDADAVERADDVVQRGVLAESTLAVGVLDAAMTDERDAGGRRFVDLEFPGVTEVLVDATAAFGRDRNKDH